MILIRSVIVCDPDNDYFLYVGVLKTYSPNCFIQETLSRRIINRSVRFITIVPDICIRYNCTNIIVINPRGDEELISDGKSPMHDNNVVTREDDGNIILKKPWNGQEVTYPDAGPALYDNTLFSFAQYEDK